MPVEFMKLRPWSCRPLDGGGHTAAKLFCGEPARPADGDGKPSPYCAAHRRICYAPPDRRPLRLPSYV
jgi:hypothetical protein